MAIKVGSSSDYGTIDNEGVYRLVGGATLFEQIHIGGLSVKLNSANDPVIATPYGGLILYSFPTGVTSEVFFVVQFPHIYKYAASPLWHVHFMLSAAPVSDEDVRWGLEYTWQIMDQTFDAATTIYALKTVTSGDADKHLVATFDYIDGTDKALGSIFMGRLFRDGGNVLDTFSGAAHLLSIDAYIEVDKLGSREQTYDL